MIFISRLLFLFSTTVFALTLNVGNNPSDLKELVPTENNMTRNYAHVLYEETGIFENKLVWEPIEGKWKIVRYEQVPIRKGHSYDYIGMPSETDHLFVVPFDSIVLFEKRGNSLYYKNYYLVKPRDGSHPIHWYGNQMLPVRKVALTGKGACGAGLIGNSNEVIAWHLGPSLILQSFEDPTSVWLDFIQHHRSKELQNIIIEAKTEEIELLSNSVKNIASSPERYFVYFEDKIDKKQPAMSPARWRQREFPYKGVSWQPFVVRYQSPEDYDSMDIISDTEKYPPFFLARVVRIGSHVNTPVQPNSAGQYWFIIRPNTESVHNTIRDDL